VRNSAFKRQPIVAVLVALAVFLTPALLFAHAHLLRSSPASGAALPTSPVALSLWFSEKPELTLTTIRLVDSSGASVALGQPAAIDSNGITVPIVGELATGRYTVTWKTAASDGHPSSGKYAFSVAVSAPAVSPVVVDSAARAESIITRKSISHSLVVPDETPTFSTAMRWAELVALLTAVGLVIFRLAVLPAAGWDAELTANASSRAVRLGRAVLLLFAITTASRGLTEASMLPGYIGTRFNALFVLVQHTRWGMMWAIGAAGVIIAFVGLLFAEKALSGWIVAAIGLVVVAVSEALTGHSGTVPHPAAAIAADVAHLLGAGGWLGGLTAVLLCGLPAVRRLDEARLNDAGSRLVRAYHGSAIECVVVVVLSAIVAAWVRFPSVSALWTTPYGLALLRKTIVVLVLLGFGFYHWRRVVIPTWTSHTLSRFRRTAVAELLFGAVVVALTAYLIAQPLP
jgi:copper transport protein